MSRPRSSSTMRRTRRFAVSLGGLAALLLATVAVPTSAGYPATPASVAQATGVGVDWAAPTIARIDGGVVDAAYDPRTGMTYIVALNVSGTTLNNRGILVSPKPGEGATFRELPGFPTARGISVDGLAIDAGAHRLWVVLRDGFSATVPLQLVTFAVGADGSLTFEEAVALQYSAGGTLTALDVQDGVAAVAYSSKNQDRDFVEVFTAAPLTFTLRSIMNHSPGNVLDISVAPGGQRVFVAVRITGGLQPATQCEHEGCRLGMYMTQTQVEAVTSTEAWWDMNSTVTRTGDVVAGAALDYFGGWQVSTPATASALAVERVSGTVFWAGLNSSSVSRLGLNGAIAPGFDLPEIAETIPVKKPVANLISGNGVVLVLHTDGALTWVIA